MDTHNSLRISNACISHVGVQISIMADTPLHMSAQLHSTRPQIAILDFGSQYSHLIARRVRELNVFCELYSCLVKGEVLRKNNVIGIILSGGPNSVYEVSQRPPRPMLFLLLLCLDSSVI